MSITHWPKAAAVLLVPFCVISFAPTTGECQPTFVREWGSAGNGDGQFSGPHGIVVDAHGKIFVADTGNNRIQKFASDGTFLMKWGSFANF